MPIHFWQWSVVVHFPGLLSFSHVLKQAILLNRIQHIVVPPRGHTPGRLGMWFPRLFPINANSTSTRLFMRAPSLYLLYKSLLRITIILLQAFEVYPTARIFSGIGQWAANASMVDVCWSTFGAVCAALIVGTFNRGLDGR